MRGWAVRFCVGEDIIGRRAKGSLHGRGSGWLSDIDWGRDREICVFFPMGLEKWWSYCAMCGLFWDSGSFWEGETLLNFGPARAHRYILQEPSTRDILYKN